MTKRGERVEEEKKGEEGDVTAAVIAVAVVAAKALEKWRMLLIQCLYRFTFMQQ